MKSSTGAHYLALDHVRALAAFLVFSWHFIHGSTGAPVPFESAPNIFFLAIFDEGHTGVALFMALSGYLFAKLLDGREIHYGAFLWNRCLRLVPLLAAVIAFLCVRDHLDGKSIADYPSRIFRGLVRPTLPNGGWSITVEFHFYLLLPVLLMLSSKSRLWPVAIVLPAITLRALLHEMHGEVQSLAYWTLVGRIDQFVLGMACYQYRHIFAGRHILAGTLGMAFLIFFWGFDTNGGFYKNPSYPSPSTLWIFLPTIEGLAYGALIAWYDNSFNPRPSGISKFIGRLGEFSYSIYLLHFFFVFKAAWVVNEKIMRLSNFYVALAWSAILFSLMVIPGFFSYVVIEAPFLRFRKPYFRPIKSERGI